ncbi:MAG TPA: nitroreductase/quinone reductase family protein [Dermatophilaceae bacterium]|nr:nitroreductase/quinone reductase family protein [Dermatophilaceae bacterium]
MSAQRRHLLPEGFFRPVDYAARTRYRRPSGFYRRLQSVAPVFSALGLTPDYVVRLEVPGRRTGLIRSSFMVMVACGGQRFLVALAGESEWVRNVRAAHGHVVVRHDGQRYAAHLSEVPVTERVEVIRAYIHRPSPRGRPMVRTGEARHYFGIEPDATLPEIEAVAPNYPVFRVDRVGSSDSLHSRPEVPPGP